MMQLRFYRTWRRKLGEDERSCNLIFVNLQPTPRGSAILYDLRGVWPSHAILVCCCNDYYLLRCHGSTQP